MNNAQIRQFFEGRGQIPCPETERLTAGGFRQKSGGYIRYARQCGIENPSQYWHLMTSWSARSAPDAPFDRRIQCGELIFWMAEVSGAVSRAVLRGLADRILSGAAGRRRSANRLIQTVCFDSIVCAVTAPCLMTPFGRMLLLADGRAIPCSARALPPDARRFPDAAGRFRIEAVLRPDGAAHTLSLVLPDLPADAGVCRESGEGMEAVSFCGAGGVRLTAALAGTVCRVGGQYDYDCQYEQNGITCRILPETKTAVFPFGAAWTEGVSSSAAGQPSDVQTWLAADPTAAD